MAPTLETSATRPPTEVQKHIDQELKALAEGELRTEQQVTKLFDLLTEATPAQLALAEQLQVALLARGRPLKALPMLGIDVVSRSDGKKDLRYFEAMLPDRPLTQEDLNPTSTNSFLFQGELKREALVDVQDARLVSPNLGTLGGYENQKNAYRVDMLREGQSRITYLHGIPATWDRYIDGKAWSTNIDTVYFIDWLKSAKAFGPSVKRSVEIGCGVGGISQAVLDSCPNLERHIFTDIDPNAINATRRNTRPLANGKEVTWAIGKGLHGLTAPGSLDLIVTNPPYIPNPTGEGDRDHYSGTKLIERLFQDGIPLLDPANPDAAIYVQMSSVTLPDFDRYRAKYPDVEVTPICEPVRVPLRIMGLLREPHVLEFVRKQGGLEYVEDDPILYYHEIMAFKLSPKR